MELVSYLTDGNVATFLLLLLRFGGIVAFFPFFDNQLIPANIKGSLVFMLVMLMFPMAEQPKIQATMLELAVMGFGELLFGFIASLGLQLAFAALEFGAELTSQSAGLSMASVFDPSSGRVQPVVAQIILMLGIMMFLVFDIHHYILWFVYKSLIYVPLGSFVLSGDFLLPIIKLFTNMFIMGFSIAFPVIAFMLMADIIFGMLMKNHPQFNILIIGFPIKIAIVFIVFIVTLPSIMYVFGIELDKGLEFMKIFNK